MSEQDSSQMKNPLCGVGRAESTRGDGSVSGGVQRRRTAIVGNVGRRGVHPFPRILEFPATLDADLVGPFPDGEPTAQPAMTAAAKNRKIQPGGFINPAPGAGVRNFYGLPAKPEDSARWREPARSRSRPRRSKY